jgi:hypothetical protein
MRASRSTRPNRHSRAHLTLNAIKDFLDSVFAALWYTVDGTDFVEMFSNNAMVLSSDPGETYVPATFAGTITPPDVAGYKTADANNVLYDGGGTPQALSVSDLIDADLPRIPVKYDSTAPHHIRMIGLFDPTVYGSLTDADKERVSNYMDLWMFYWGEILGGNIKDNRSLS